MLQGIILKNFFHVNSKNFGPPMLLIIKSKDGGGSHRRGMVTLTSFLREIIQKFFFIQWDFLILANQENIFLILGGQNGALEGFWPISGLKIASFGQFSIKFHVFHFLFKNLCIPSYTSKH